MYPVGMVTIWKVPLRIHFLHIFFSQCRCIETQWIDSVILTAVHKVFSWQGEHHLIPLSIHTHFYNHHHPIYAWNHPFLTIWHALSLLMSRQIAALYLLFKLCPHFHRPLSTYLSVVSSDYTCLVPRCSLLSTILSGFWLMEALFHSKHSVFNQ